jgi:hypothetical protein
MLPSSVGAPPLDEPPLDEPPLELPKPGGEVLDPEHPTIGSATRSASNEAPGPWPSCRFTERVVGVAR